MKSKILSTLLFIGVSHYSICQSYNFESYFIKSETLTGNRIVKFHSMIGVEHLGNEQYKIISKLEPSGELFAAITFNEKSFFAGRTYYQYDGQGLFRGKKVKFIIESGRDLKDFSSGIGYSQHSNLDLSLFLIKIYYWLADYEEPLLKNHISFFPIESPKTNEVEGKVPDISKIINEFIEAVSSGDPKIIAKRVKYPLRVSSLTKQIMNEAQFVEVYDKIFTKEFRISILNSNIDKDWGGRVYEGLMFRNGDLWIDFNGNIIAINFIP